MDLLSTEMRVVVDCPRYKRMVVVDEMCEECIYAGEEQAPETKIWCDYVRKHKEKVKEIHNQYQNYYGYCEGEEEDG